MKKLTGIRLINWHAFQNEIINVHNSIMISGENGTGKSTILDAIQFVLTCSKNSFNKAANESSKRTLEGYVRFKTGKEEKEELKNNIIIQLNSNGDYQAVKGLEDKIKALKEKQKEYLKYQYDFEEMVKSQKEYFKLLSSTYDNYYLEFYETLCNLTHETSEKFSIGSYEVEEYVNNRKNDLDKKIAALQFNIDQLNKDLLQSEGKIEELKKRNLVYPESVKKLRNIIIEESKNEGKVIEPKILCEVLEITDSVWKNAVEGYLNTQRFYLLVEKEQFDRALKIYERYMKKNNIYNVGIINTSGLERYEDCEANTLANVVTSKSKDAKRYINFILGKVIRCENVEELKNYKTSITSTCMVYKNNVARAIDPKIYNTPYIGSEAYKIQLEQEEIKYKVLKDKLSENGITLSFQESHKKLLSNLKIEGLREKQIILKNVYYNKCKIEEAEEERRKLEKNSSYIDIKLKLSEVESEIHKLIGKLGELEDYKIEYSSKCKVCEKDILQKGCYIQEKKDICKVFKEEIGGLANLGEERFKLERKNRELENIRYNFNNAKLRSKYMMEKADENLKSKMREYNNDYSLGGEVGVDGIDTFIKALDDLVKSRVIEFEEKVKDAKKNAEEEFKHHFIAKLKANIDNARLEFKELNRGLKEIYFGDESYEFKVVKSNELNKYHDMVMDEENIAEGFNLFTDIYQMKYKEILDELFEKLILDDSNSENELKKLTDYRNYMDYDIQINYKDGTYSLFSKVCKEKSGGETQTPYYVIIASSFLQLYKSVTRRETIGLVLFDEAFDKMDDGRIASMMEFFKKVNLQVIVASPPQKIEVIAPYVNTILLAMNIDKFSVIEEYKHERL